MKIFLFWNRIDSDSKKIYRFLEDQCFQEEIAKTHSLIIHKPYAKFQITEEMKTQILESDLVLFFTHGEEDVILKSRYKQTHLKKQFSFIDSNDARLLSDKRVIAICCSSAKELGPLCVDSPINSKYYIGFQEPITYDDGAHEKVRGLIYTAYSDAFKEAFRHALTTNCSAHQFVLILRKNISDMLTGTILSETNTRVFGSVSPITFHYASAASLVALGDAKLPVFA